MTRAVRTAQAIAQPHGLEVRIHPGLNDTCHLSGRT
ncbi:MAG: histidine phosphatase family protein [Candidatus Aminicenantes bacterium]|nr:histidine phosphatase family protein [Candidatus Aminicenantes bacterium]